MAGDVASRRRDGGSARDARASLRSRGRVRDAGEAPGAEGRDGAREGGAGHRARGHGGWRGAHVAFVRASPSRAPRPSRRRAEAARALRGGAREDPARPGALRGEGARGAPGGGDRGTRAEPLRTAPRPAPSHARALLRLRNRPAGTPRRGTPRPSTRARATELRGALAPRLPRDRARRHPRPELGVRAPGGTQTRPAPRRPRASARASPAPARPRAAPGAAALDVRQATAERRGGRATERGAPRRRRRRPRGDAAGRRRERRDRADGRLRRFRRRFRRRRRAFADPDDDASPRRRVDSPREPPRRRGRADPGR